MKKYQFWANKWQNISKSITRVLWNLFPKKWINMGINILWNAKILKIFVRDKSRWFNKMKNKLKCNSQFFFRNNKLTYYDSISVHYQALNSNLTKNLFSVKTLSNAHKLTHLGRMIRNHKIMNCVKLTLSMSLMIIW